MKLPIYLEIGTKRTFAAARDWPGWARSGRDEAGAVQALLEYAPRYAAVLRPARLDFDPPEQVSGVRVVERLEGDATTDFGTPGRIPAHDNRRLDAAQLDEMKSLLRACWRAFDKIVEKAHGRSLRPGARGGGRDLEKIVRHVTDAQHAYITMAGWQWPKAKDAAESPDGDQLRQIALKALVASAHGELPTHGPRGGIRWPARYFVRRAAWHVLDHAWEIEDRLE